ncbi:acyl-CoA dehydrogenase [Mycobacterium intermedium]|uniref:Acyl-CoA dehydrogenase n=1 Tax=Mycobacterium intermedium TaxID=28445 RepID=A0A1E3SKY7_MYCIE|nr:acyl-CoA dehydrogenase [Mycobacterium intermedium]MCV6963419.1 acyl-CoA dehydrogenase [Mycobacterium intermedium]ODR02815.1 acyl-CoA dehydrogenase [Mycobacterium intermedium]OPE47654.1 acyl-CoA dehydrogenase [Mycobacterium intermedium]ORA98670.1 acyl-CoA dehydrogenase [Mycobacterium intermedium]
MDFEFTEEQRGLVDSTRSLLTAKAPIERTRKLAETEHRFDAELWRYGAELGWPALAIAESDGGLGQQIIDLTLVAVELGRALASTPFIPVVVAADVLAHSHHERKSELLQSICAGTLIATWAFAEFGQPWSVAGLRTRAEPVGRGYELSGAKVSVQDGDIAELVVVDAVLDDAPARFLVPTDTAGVHTRRQQTLDVTRGYCDVDFDHVSVDASALLSRGDSAQIGRTLQLITVLTCAELVGIGQRLLDMTTEYVKNRVQFGRPVGSFQAVKHKCADMRMWVQASTAATYYAAMALDADHHDTERLVSVAKAYVSDAVNRVAGQALQLHGGIGFTWEHDLHLYLRRARVGSMLYGDVRHHRERLCQILQSGVGEQ